MGKQDWTKKTPRLRESSPAQHTQGPTGPPRRSGGVSVGRTFVYDGHFRILRQHSMISMLSMVQAFWGLLVVSCWFVETPPRDFASGSASRCLFNRPLNPSG